MALGTATKQGAGSGGSSSTITSFLGSTTNAPMNITQVGGSSFALGQALAAASLPVVLTASQLSTLTPPSNTGYALDSSLTTIDTDLKSNITLHAGTNTIGSVKLTDGTNTQTFMSTTTTSKFGADVNILSILGTAPTTAGKLDVKGADGDVFVRQTTGSNLHTVVDSGTVTNVSTVSNISQIASTTPTFTSQALDVNIKSETAPAVTLTRVAIAASSSGDNTLIAAVSAKKIYVVAFELSFSGTVNAKFTDGASGTNLGGLYYGVANAGAANSISPDMKLATPSPYLWAGSTNTDLILNLSEATAVGGAITYFTV